MTVNAAQLDASYGVHSTEATCWHQHSGGQGKRRLIMIPPDSDAYTGTLIRSATTAGKITLYISPLQHEFDLSPLPPDAIEFQSMPRAQCQTCNVSFPLQILALHVQECMESQAGSEDIEVDLSTEDSIQGLSDEILNCGYTGAISVQNKESIVRYARTSISVRIEKYNSRVNAEFVMTSIVPQLVDNEEIMNFIQDFFYEAEAEERGHGDDKDGPHSITPARFLQWITGQGHVPLLPLEQDFVVTIKFNHDCSADFGHHNVCYPVVSACAKTIVLPVRHMNNSQRF
ncbi:hypothetical protein F2P81_025328 [Scophthalmus maximus]|uniref:HECT domain-containing protein n=1 Tax=Scophthalmus maximus TaxID=52904 RepID=A0A6A4RIV9_SCOMX|nr:hypothetical protein F2P81_025328 [Scophthalmus maximus]